MMFLFMLGASSLLGNIKIVAGDQGNPDPDPVCGSYMIIGGKDKTSIELWQNSGDQAFGDCDSFADAPFPTQNAIALKDVDGRPMVCGGSKNPDPRSCHVYDIYTNTWSEGPSLKQRRISATATCLPNGECWVFGGISTASQAYTEYYNPTTNTFELGPLMPVVSLRPCSAVGPSSGLIYLTSAKRSEGITMLFTFDPTTRTFNELLPALDAARFYPACTVLVDENDGAENFYMVGGGIHPRAPSSTTFIYNTQEGAWQQGPDYPTSTYAPSIMPNYDTKTDFAILGGITSSSGTELRLISNYNACLDEYAEDGETMEARSHALVRLVPNVCPGATKETIDDNFFACEY